MSKYDNHNTSHLPLVESVIIVAIFAVISVFIMQMYVTADRLQGKSVTISKATMLAENYIEAVKGGAEELPSNEQEGDATDDGTVNYVLYSEDWERLDAGVPEDFARAAYFMLSVVDSVRSGETGTYADFTVSVYDIGDGTLEPNRENLLASISSGVYKQAK